MRHVPVLLKEVLESLRLRSRMDVVDCTIGDAGHAEAILAKTVPDGRLLAIDADPESLLRAKKNLYSAGNRVTFVRDNFVELKKIIEREKFGPVSAILIDLGWSSPQFAERGRGFSFEKDESLDMRYGGEPQGEYATAADVLNKGAEEELEKIFREYGEERLSREIAKGVVDARKQQSIERTNQFIEIILDVDRKKLKTTKDIPWVGGLHPATKVFQALRIAVNNELGVIEQVLPQAVDVLAPGGRLAVITFHSLEDRIVKHWFKSIEKKSIHLVNRKAIVCSPEEAEINPRARSAKLRVVEKI